MFFWEKGDIHHTLLNTFRYLYPVLELARPFEIGIIDIFRRWCKLNFGPLRSKVKLHQGYM